MMTHLPSPRRLSAASVVRHTIAWLPVLALGALAGLVLAMWWG